VKSALEVLRPLLTDLVLTTVRGAEQVFFLSLEDVIEGGEHDGPWRPPEELREPLRRLRCHGVPASWAGWLLLPWPPEPPVSVALVVQGEAMPSLPQEQVEELAGNLARQLGLACQAAVDPVSGLYNLRALQPQLEGLLAAGRGLLLALVGVDLPAAGPWDTQGLWQRSIALFETVSSLPPFLLGGNLFALVLDPRGPSEARTWARTCLRRLRRTGITGAHIGMVRVEAGQTIGFDVRELLRRGREAYATARRQGRLGQELWGDGLPAFADPPAPPGLEALLRRRDGGACALVLLAADTGQALPTVSVLLDTLTGQEGACPQSAPPSCHAAGEQHVFLFLPGADGAAALAQLQRLRQGMTDGPPVPGFSCGVAVYPGARGEARTTLPAQCRKALRHAGFFGPSSDTLYDAVSCNICGDWYYDQGDLRGAVREYRLGLRLAPDDVNLLNSLGVALAELCEHRRAVASFRRVLARDLGNFMAWINLGQSLTELGDEEGALACFESALDSGGQEAAGMDVRTRCDLLLQMGRIYGRRHRHQEALTLLGRCLAECPRQESQILPLLAQSHAALDQREQAVRCAQRALRLRPEDGAMLSLLGTLYLQGGEGEDVSLSLCRRAVSLTAGDPECWRRLAWVLLRLGRADDETQAAVRRCEQLAPRHPELSSLKKLLRGLVRPTKDGRRRGGGGKDKGSHLSGMGS